MKPTTLQALLTDQTLDELDPMVSELLDAYVSRDSQAALLRTQIRNALPVAREALERHPELIPREEQNDANVTPMVLKRSASAWLRAAAMLAVGFGLGIGGTIYWNAQHTADKAMVAENNHASTNKPPIAWREYRVAYDAKKGQLQLR
jgi:hypothetical protein